MADLPKYLTSPGAAISMRKRWENRLTEEMQYVAHLNEHRPWGMIVKSMIKDIPDLPSWSHSLLRNARADDEPEDEIDRLARTISTAAYNTHVLNRLVEAGFGYKQWLTRHDPKVRQSHRDADGQKQPIGKPFRLDGGVLQYPGDSQTAPIDLWFGCRCMVIGKV